MEKIKVLVADDMEVIVQQIVSELSKKENVEIVGTAYNGKEELEKILELKPNIVFTDNQMPYLNGIEVIEKIFESDMENKPKFVLVTGDRDLYVRAMRNDVFSIVNKPINLEKLKDLVDEYVLMSEYKQEKKSLKKRNKNLFQKLFAK